MAVAIVGGLWAAAVAGCASPDARHSALPLSQVRAHATPPTPTPRQAKPDTAIQQAQAVEPPKPLPPNAALTAEVVIDQVLARNPSLAQMQAAVQMAAARYPQVTSLDDPTFTSWLAPSSLGSNKVNDSARFELSQKFPFPGKRALRGEAALAQTVAAGHDVEDTKLQLVESVRTAFADYYLADRALEVNDEGLKLLEEFKQNAETRYKTGQVPEQDVLQANVEIGRQREARLGVERARTVAVARLNTLMNLAPESALPPPVKALRPPSTLPTAQELRDVATARRPDLQAIQARLAADQASLGLARKEYYPDVEAMAAYDSFWQAADDQQRLRPQVGLRINLPLRIGRRDGAVSEAEGQLLQRRAALAQQQNQIAFDIQQASAQVRESEQAIKLYADTILPAARESVKSAQTAYVTGKVPFLTLIEAQRSLIELRDRAYAAGADYERRLATLERAVGGPLPSPAAGPLPTGGKPASGVPHTPHAK